MNIANDVTKLIGKTPIVKLNFASKVSGATILAKCEFMNPSGSVKDRVALNMIERAIESKEIDSDTTIIEPTSGNTGIGLASVCASKGLKLILTMPNSMSIERRKLLKAYGAELVLTDSAKGMSESIRVANELQLKTPNSIVLQQFQNSNNPQAHELTTAEEILEDCDNNIDAFVASVGTGGTISGTANRLKKSVSHIKVFAIEPKNSAVISGEAPNPHAIQGIGAGFIPKNLDISVISEIIKVSDEDAINMAKQIAKKEGLLVGISSGANVCASIDVASREEFKGKTIVTILCDTGERYLSTELFDDE